MGAGFSRQFGVEADGANYPAPFAFKLAGKQMCSGKLIDLPGADGTASGKLLVICSGENRLKMENGSVFSTGHNPTELFVPLYHLNKAGYEIEICTPDAKPVTVEQWAMPACELGGYAAQVEAIQSTLKSRLEAPTDIANVSPTLEGYCGVFIPGGHGPMINMHTQQAVGVLLAAAHKKGLPTATLCHGPNALRATTLTKEGFAYEGYSICCFPDKADNMPFLRYLPGPMVVKCEAELTKLKAKIANSAMDDKVVTDRELVTGSSQRAAQNLAAAFVKLLKKGPVAPAASA